MRRERLHHPIRLSSRADRSGLVLGSEQTCVVAQRALVAGQMRGQRLQRQGQPLARVTDVGERQGQESAYGVIEVVRTSIQLRPEQRHCIGWAAEIAQ